MQIILRSILSKGNLRETGLQKNNPRAKIIRTYNISSRRFFSRVTVGVAHREAVTRDRMKFREQDSRVPASRHESFRAGKCILANMTSFSGTGVLAAKTDTPVRGVRARLHRRLYFSPFYSAAVLRALRSTVISVCTALFMTATADCTTLAHAE